VIDTASIVSRRVPFPSKSNFVSYMSGRRIVVDKGQLLVDLCRGRSVLDIGCVDHTMDRVEASGGEWIHGRIHEVASELVGVDILVDEVAALVARGFDVRCEDAEVLDLGRTFDVVVGGDIIEHMSNPGLFLDSVARHLGPGSIFVLTTPNPFNIDQFVTAITRNFIGVNDEHTVWLDPRVLAELVSRSPLELVDMVWVDTQYDGLCIPGWRGRVATRLSALVRNRRPVCRREYAAVLVRPTGD